MSSEPNLPRTAKGAAAPERGSHQFAVGQSVRLSGAYAKSGDIFVVTATLPPIGDTPQYRIRNEAERFERVATQNNLERALASHADSGAAHAEKSFARQQDK